MRMIIYDTLSIGAAILSIIMFIMGGIEYAAFMIGLAIYLKM